MVGLAITGGLVIFIFSQTLPAQAQLSAFVPYGGTTVTYIPPVVTPPCPGYYVIKNAETLSITPQFGVYLPPGGESLLYDYRNLITPGTPVIGGYEPIPFPTCAAAYPVYPIFWSAPFFLTGTGAF
jgi:hypothetical protein